MMDSLKNQQNPETQNAETQKASLVINKESINYLSETRKWTMFFAILGFIAIGLMVLGAMVMGVIGVIGGAFGNREAMVMGVLTFVYLIFAVLYFFPAYYLLKFSTHMNKAVNQAEQNDLAKAFFNLKSHFRFVGILTIVMIGLYILIIMGFLIFGASSMFHM